MEGQLICFVAFSALIGAKDGAVRRVWRAVLGGTRVLEHGRPTISEQRLDPMKSDASISCFEWIRQWGREAGEQDSNSKDYDTVLDPIDVGEIYKEYLTQFRWIGCGDGLQAVSSKQFQRLFRRWMDKDRVRVRQKKNITTKCDGE